MIPFAPGPVVPVVVPLDLHLSPADLAARLRRRPGFAFLDSATAPDRGAVHPHERRSVLAWAPPVTLRARGRRVSVRMFGRWSRVHGDPLDVLAQALSPRVPPGPLPAPGALGYLAWDLYPHLDRFAPRRARDDSHLPDLLLGLHDAQLVYDHVAGEWSVVVAPVFADRPAERIVAEVRATLSALPAAPPARARVGPVRPDRPPAAHRAAVEAALEHIRAGDIYQVNLAQRFSAALRGDPWAVYARLRADNPARFAAYLDAGDHAVLSASPELFLASDGETIETRPIKGTRPRGATAADDARLEAALRSSPKETAELSMIVDLERNDLGRVCTFGSVSVREHRVVERLPTLFHTHSTVVGRLRPGVNAAGLVRATFPGGSVSGCPKIRAVEVIDALEPTRRHLYTGAIGLFGFDGATRLNIAIRTIVTHAGTARFHVGGGIVADSEPEDEYVETLHKAAALRRALEG